MNEGSVDLNGQKLRRRWFVRSKGPDEQKFTPYIRKSTCSEGRRGHAPNHPLVVQPHRADA